GERDAQPVAWGVNRYGNADSQNCLGRCYSHGTGVPKDDAEAVKWYRKAAEQGEANAQANLGACYLDGTGVTKDETEAVKWYRKSAEQGNAYGQNGLGACYFNGTGVPKDAAEAVKWCRKSAEQGNNYASTNLIEMEQIKAREAYSTIEAQSDIPTKIVHANFGVSISIPVSASYELSGQNQLTVRTDFSSGIFAINFQCVQTPFTRDVLEQLGIEKIKSICISELEQKTKNRGTKWTVISCKFVKCGGFDGLLIKSKENKSSEFQLGSYHFYSSMNGKGLDLNVFYFINSIKPGVVESILKSLSSE
ncbi:MAG TPA: tetratricopeptide repeat protein, partial [Syntrophobacteraceae bacterium]|nr:tetratricopeptide repeat protein [Syntrophobacteraceae bacterium]